MLTNVLFTLLTVPIWMSVTLNEQPVSNTDPTEEYDMLMTDGEIELGLVRVRKNNETYCVVVADVKENLGFTLSLDDQECLSVQDLSKIHGIPLTLNLSSVELLLDNGYRYPTKDFRLAKANIEKTPHGIHQHILTLSNNRKSILPESRRIDLSLMTHNQLLQSPDVQTVLAGDVLRGSFSISGIAAKDTSGDTYHIRRTDFNWSWKPRNRKNIVPIIEIGTALVNERTPLTRGIRISNKPLSSGEMNMAEFVQFNAPIGSIIEWTHHSGISGASLVSNHRFNGIVAPIEYGLNKFTYSITKPGELTLHKEHWIRVPKQMLPKGRIEYQSTIGSIKMIGSTGLVSNRVDYGLSNDVSVSADQIALIADGTVKNWGGTRIAWTPTHTSEVLGYLGSDSSYLLTASYWNPSYGSIEISDSKETSYLFQSYRPNRRHSMIRASTISNRYVRYQISYFRTDYRHAIEHSVESFANTSFRRWILGANLSYKKWDNYGKQSSGHTSIYWNLGYRLKNRLMISSDVYAALSNHVQIESFRLASHYNTNHMQLGGSISMSTPFQSVSIGVYARIATDWITMSTRNDLYGGQYLGSHVLSTSWMKSRPSEWHPSSQTSNESTGFSLIPFHDRNGNGVKDSNEIVLSGLMGSIRDGRQVELKNSVDRLVFGGLQPNRQYLIALETDLRNEPDYLVQSTRINVESPGSGYRLIYVPVIKSVEFSGMWDVLAGAMIKLGQTDLIFTRIDGSFSVRGTLFSDGTWIVDKIGTGLYEIKVISRGNDVFVTSPSVLHIDTSNMLENPKISIIPKS